jgi:hypothetical protein
VKEPKKDKNPTEHNKASIALLKPIVIVISPATLNKGKVIAIAIYIIEIVNQFTDFSIGVCSRSKSFSIVYYYEILINFIIKI